MTYEIHHSSKYPIAGACARFRHVGEEHKERGRETAGHCGDELDRYGRVYLRGGRLRD